MRIHAHVKILILMYPLTKWSKKCEKYGASLAVNKPLNSSQLNNIGSNETALLHMFSLNFDIKDYLWLVWENVKAF